MISGYVRNEELVKSLEEIDYGFEFPIYFSSLKNRLYAQVRKHRIRNNAAIVLSNIFKLNYPSHPVTHEVLSYLKDVYLVILGTPVKTNLTGLRCVESPGPKSKAAVKPRGNLCGCLVL